MYNVIVKITVYLMLGRKNYNWTNYQHIPYAKGSVALFVWRDWATYAGSINTSVFCNTIVSTLEPMTNNKSLVDLQIIARK